MHTLGITLARVAPGEVRFRDRDWSLPELLATCRRGLESAANLALSRTHYEVDIEHLLVELLDAQDAGDLASRFLRTLPRLYNAVEDQLTRLVPGWPADRRLPAISPRRSAC